MVTSISFYNTVPPPQQRQGTPPVQEVNWEFIDLKLSSPEKWSISCKPGHLLIASIGAFLAFLGYLWFWMGNIKVARWNGLKILIPKHMWKSKIGLLEQIWGQNPYDTFFLGHPVVRFSDWSKAASSSGLGGTPSLVGPWLAGSLECGYHLVASRLEQEVVVAEEEGKVVSYLVLVLMNLSQNPCSMGSRKCLRGRRLKSLYQIPGTWKL